ncbi:hypothetical protein [Roseofilum casamattae]|uniref:Uncharacterized protein n=1 Tax=Roseofilum casamattae BLCC-M143 TaxID=3022442 RepID=A0ABT7C2V8_9CYAN|nr:hypothetical protein [Roseofilum casamattae]MDJ1185761.1 hypothetical protein [Roseofilum casamattae BLCC-M143]
MKGKPAIASAMHRTYRPTIKPVSQVRDRILALAISDRDRNVKFCHDIREIV